MASRQVSPGTAASAFHMLGDPLGADRERHVLPGGGAGQLAGEVPGIGAQRELPPCRPRRPGWPGAGRPAPGPSGLVTCERGSWSPDSRSAASGISVSAHDATCGGGPPAAPGSYRPPRASWTRTPRRRWRRCRSSPALRPAPPPARRQQAHHPRRRHRQPRLRAPPVPLGEPAGDPGRGRGGQARHRASPAGRAGRASRSRPTRKSSPASCAAAIPASTCPPVKPRRRCFTGPIASSSASIRPSLPHSSVTASIPPEAVSDGSGSAPIWILPRVLPRTAVASTIPVTPLPGSSSTITLDNPSRAP